MPTLIHFQTSTTAPLNGRNYLPMLGMKLLHVSKGGPGWQAKFTHGGLVTHTGVSATSLDQITNSCRLSKIQSKRQKKIWKKEHVRMSSAKVRPVDIDVLNSECPWRSYYTTHIKLTTPSVCKSFFSHYAFELSKTLSCSCWSISRALHWQKQSAFSLYFETYESADSSYDKSSLV